MALPLGLGATVGGYLLGNLVPKHLQGILHPVVVCALAANFGAWLHGSIMGWSYAASLRAYFSKVRVRAAVERARVAVARSVWVAAASVPRMRRPGAVFCLAGGMQIERVLRAGSSGGYLWYAASLLSHARRNGTASCHWLNLNGTQDIAAFKHLRGVASPTHWKGGACPTHSKGVASPKHWKGVASPKHWKGGCISQKPEGSRISQTLEGGHVSQTKHSSTPTSPLPPPRKTRSEPHSCSQHVRLLRLMLRLGRGISMADRSHSHLVRSGMITAQKATFR